jgi:thioredoxin reductase (NADPH)
VVLAAVAGDLARLRTAAIAYTVFGALVARTVLVATGATWRRIGVPELEALTGRGVFYGAAVSEAPAMRGRHVFIVGGGNSAGQAAVHLSRYAERVTVLIRRAALVETMSDYLIRELQALPNVDIRPRVQVVGGSGTDFLETVTVRDLDTDADLVESGVLFVLIGSEPRTDWLAGALARDRWGFLLTGTQLLTDDASPSWPLERPPALLETSTPGVFAAGDVRAGSIKRVASAVGEGALAVTLVHGPWCTRTSPRRRTHRRDHRRIAAGRSAPDTPGHPTEFLADSLSVTWGRTDLTGSKPLAGR